MKNFFEFLDKKHREAQKHLGVIKKILDNAGYRTQEFFEDEEPYVYVYAPKSVSFGGIRIYEIGKTIAYKVQRENKTHPYGKAYLLDVEEMFDDLLSDNIEDEDAAKKVIESIVSEIKNFFEKSAQAEKDIDGELDPLEKAIIPTGGTDWSQKVTSPGYGSSAGR